MSVSLQQRFQEALPAGLSFCSLRASRERTQILTVQRGILQPIFDSEDSGLMITVHHQGGLGYAATSDDSVSGIRSAIARATRWAEHCANRAVFSTTEIQLSHPKGNYRVPVHKPWKDTPLSEKTWSVKFNAK